MIHRVNKFHCSALSVMLISFLSCSFVYTVNEQKSSEGYKIVKYIFG